MLQNYFNTSFLGASCLLLAGPAAALDTVRCKDVAGEIALIYVIDRSAVQPILSVEMQLTGDFGLATDTVHPDYDVEYLSNGFVGDSVEGADLSWKDDNGHAHLAMSFRIGRVSEARVALVGGTVSVAGGGLWMVTCQSSALDMY